MLWARNIKRLVKALLPYGFMVWWLDYKYDTVIDRPLLFYKGYARILKRAVKWILPYFIVMRVRQPYDGVPDLTPVDCEAASGARRVSDCANWTGCKAWIRHDAADDVRLRMIDIVVPVYNGMQYLPRLFQTIGRTRMPFRLIVVNDCSPDASVRPFLESQKAEFKNYCLIDNDTNLGFVQSVNKALRISENDVALVNTDVELPDGWLERLMKPILENEDVASATPFTNSGTICSFPNMCEDNALFLDLSVEQIDESFKCVEPRYIQVPTGVGFCMGMKRDAIAKVGVFDAEAFYKGYGEENDWCQRAIRAGYKNVIVENLFVYHKHGGSFASEAKLRYIQRNGQILAKRYPNYNRDVADFISANPHKALRECLKYQICKRLASSSVVIFDHDWGGGANVFCDKMRDECLDNGQSVYRVISNCFNGLRVEFFFRDFVSYIRIDGVDEVKEIVADSRVKRLVVNELTSFSSMPEVLNVIKDIKQGHRARLEYMAHDLYAVCPSFYLLDNTGRHCGFASCDKCVSCYRKNAFRNEWVDLPLSVKDWREWFRELFAVCDEIRFFSDNTRRYYECHYGSLANATVIPHELNIALRVPVVKENAPVLTIATLGNIMYQKGFGVIREMVNLIERNKLPVRVVCIGNNLELTKCKGIIYSGKYRRQDLPDLMEKYNVSVVFISSIWPETFSYTTHEAIAMNMPVASFDIGAPADSIRQYDKGIIINEMSARAALQTIGKHFGRTFNI